MTDATPDLQPLTETQIAGMTDSGSFSRGKTYFRKGHIISPSREGQVLRSLCQGSDSDYQVTATIALAGTRATSNPTAWECTCPRGGFCKHIVALLLAWVQTPDAFRVQQPLADALAPLDRDDLISVVTGLVAHTPDLREVLEVLIQTADPRATSRPGMPAAEARARSRKAYREFVNHQYAAPWGQRGVMTSGLDSLIDSAEQFARMGAWRQAIPFATGLLEEVADVFDEYNDEEGLIRETASRAEQVLVGALAAQHKEPDAQHLTDEERKRIITTLFDLWYTDVFKLGGIDLAGEGPEAIVAYATAEERLGVLAQVQTMQSSNTWVQDMVDEFKAMLLEAGEIDDEQLLALYLDNQLWAEAAELYVKLGRPADAIALARRHLRRGRDRQQVATALASAGPDERAQAIQLVEDTLWETEGPLPGLDQMLRDWLMEHYLAAGAADKVLPMAMTSFRKRPGVEEWNRLRTVAQTGTLPPATWDDTRSEALHHLQQTGNWHLVATILLDEGDFPGALAAYHNLPEGWAYSFSDGQNDLGSRLATAAEAEYPDDAIRIYHRRALSLIGRRQRDAYRGAAAYLERIRDTMRLHGREAEWAEMIDGIRTEFRTLRALREELDARDL